MIVGGVLPRILPVQVMGCRCIDDPMTKQFGRFQVAKCMAVNRQNPISFRLAINRKSAFVSRAVRIKPLLKVDCVVSAYGEICINV